MVFYGMSGIVVLAVVLFLAVVLLVLPLQLAAKAMGAKRYGTGWCLVSLLAAAGMQMVGLSVPAYGTLAAFLLSSAAFAGILGTDYLRGMGVSILHVVFSFLLLLLAALILGLSLSALVLI